MRPMHPRPNPIVAALYTVRDLDVDVAVVHGPAGCGFMASRMLEEAGVRVVTTGFSENDLVFGGADALLETLRDVRERFHPETVAVIGTCASMIIGDDMEATIRRAGLGCTVFAVDSHGCMGDNTAGAVRAMISARDAGLVSEEEAERQVRNMTSATAMEKNVGMAGRDYLRPTRGPTKYGVCREIESVLRGGGKVAVAMIAKKELAYRFADIFLAIDQARRVLGGETFFIANLDENLGLPRIRRYCTDILSELEGSGVMIDSVIGGLDEYALVGERMREAIDGFGPDLLVVAGIPHAIPGLERDDILITDQPRELSNLISSGYVNAIGEISSHSMVMGTRRIVPLETGDTLRQLAGST